MLGLSTIGAPVVGLLKRSGPATVLREVPEIIVDSVNGHSGGLRTHVSKEVLELEPARTNGNTTFSVEAVVGTINVQTASSHRNPGIIFSGNFTVTSRHSVGSSSFVANNSGLSLATSATLTFPVTQISALHKPHLPALANTDKSGTLSLVSPSTNNVPASEVLVAQVNKFTHVKNSFPMFNLIIRDRERNYKTNLQENRRKN